MILVYWLVARWPIQKCCIHSIQILLVYYTQPFCHTIVYAIPQNTDFFRTQIFEWNYIATREFIVQNGGVSCRKWIFRTNVVKGLQLYVCGCCGTPLCWQRSATTPTNIVKVLWLAGTNVIWGLLCSLSKGSYTLESWK